MVQGSGVYCQSASSPPDYENFTSGIAVHVEGLGTIKLRLETHR